MSENEVDKNKEALKNKVEEAIDNRVKLNLDGIEEKLTAKMEYKTAFSKLDERFKDLSAIDNTIVQQVKDQYANASDVNEFRSFNEEVKKLENIQSSLQKKMNSIEQSYAAKYDAFNTKIASNGLFETVDDLFKAKMNGENIAQSRTEDGLYLTNNYLEQNEKINDSLNNIIDNIADKTDYEALSQSYNELCASAKKTNKYFTIK